jgi:O-antigen/teichoic acid export membrane protein
MMNRLAAFLKRQDIIDPDITGKAAITFSFKVGALLLSFAVFLLLARHLGVEGFGVYVFVWGLIRVLTIFGKHGMDVAATRYAGAYYEAGHWRDLFLFQRRAALILAATSLTIACGGGFIVTVVPGLSDSLRMSFYAGFALLPFWAGMAYIQALARVRKQMIAGMLPDSILRHVIQLLLIALVLALGMPMNAPLAMGTALGGVIGAFCAGLGMTWRSGIWTRVQHVPTAVSDRPYDWLKYGMVMIVIGGSAVILRQIDVIMLGLLATAAETGAYGAATRIANLATFALTAVRLVVAPRISGCYITGEMGRLQRLLCHSAALVAVSSLGIVAVIWICAPWLLGILGGDFANAWAPLRVLLMAQLISALAGPVGFVLTMTDNQRVASIIFLVTIGIDIALNAVLIPPFGIHGAAIATAIATVTWNSAMLVFAIWWLKLNPSLLALLHRRSNAAT